MSARCWCPFHNRLTGHDHECWRVYDWPTLGAEDGAG